MLILLNIIKNLQLCTISESELQKPEMVDHRPDAAEASGELLDC